MQYTDTLNKNSSSDSEIWFVKKKHANKFKKQFVEEFGIYTHKFLQLYIVKRYEISRETSSMWHSTL
jgi:hypothetical protein